MLKVAVVLHGLGANGIDTIFANLSDKWDLGKYEITYFIAVDPDAHQFWDDKVMANGVRVIHLHDLDRNRLLVWPKTLTNALKKYGPFDAIHVNMDMLNGINLWVAKRCGVPVRICHAHRSSSENSERLVKKLYLFLMRRLIRKYSTRCVACSDLAGSYFFGKADYDLVINGIDLRRFSKEPKKKHEGLRFVTVGRLTPPKNPLFLVEVFSEVVKRKTDARLTYVGDGILLEECKQLSVRLGVQNNIDFLGIRSDVDVILKQSDFFLLPSIFEGLSLALAEAQASGLTCFVSDTVSRLSDCGRCIFLSLSEKSDKWGEKIVEFIDRGMELTLDETRMEKFDITYMARTLEKMYSNEWMQNIN